MQLFPHSSLCVFLQFSFIILLLSSATALFFLLPAQEAPMETPEHSSRDHSIALKKREGFVPPVAFLELLAFFITGHNMPINSLII